MKRSSLMYTLLILGLEMIVHSRSIPTPDQTVKQTKTSVDELSVSLRGNSADILTGGTYTIGNTMCASHNKCGRNEGTTYSWCYTDTTWDYCCETPCILEGVRGQMKCRGGSDRNVCSNTPRRHTINGIPCTGTHLCGFHENKGDLYYWCEAETVKHWEACCNPNHNCSKHGYSYDWCYTGHMFTDEGWDYCKPLE